MILTPHAIIGAAVSSALPGYPVLGFFLAIASHYIVDLIPHNHYEHSRFIIKETKSIASLVNNIEAVYQLLMICFDFFIGLFFAMFIFSRDWDTLLIVLLGVAGGVLPDFLRFFYYKYKKEPFVSLAKFHNIFESKNCLDHKPILGATIQAITTITFVLISLYVKSAFLS
jgi:hypothetical protein